MNKTKIRNSVTAATDALECLLNGVEPAMLDEDWESVKELANALGSIADEVKEG